MLLRLASFKVLFHYWIFEQLPAKSVYQDWIVVLNDFIVRHLIISYENSLQSFEKFSTMSISTKEAQLGRNDAGDAGDTYR